MPLWNISYIILYPTVLPINIYNAGPVDEDYYITRFMSQFQSFQDKILGVHTYITKVFQQLMEEKLNINYEIDNLSENNIIPA